MKNLFSFLFVLLAFQGMAQLKAKLANDHFQRMEYALCTDMYDELANKAVKNGNETDAEWEYIRRAAICHYQLFQMPESIHFFDQLKLANKLTEEDREKAVQALRFQGKYNESETLIIESHNLFPENPFFTRLFEERTSFNQLFADSSFYKLYDSGINSGSGDFAPAYFQHHLVYATKSVNTRALQPHYGWDNDNYLNIKESEFINDSTLTKGTLLRHEFLSKAHDGPVSFNSNGTKMVITRNTMSKEKGKELVVLALYFSELKNGKWTDLQPFAFNNSAYNVGHAVFAESDRALYFVSDKPGGYGETDIYVSRLDGDAWSEPVNLGPAINTEQQEMFPFVVNGTLYFASNGHFGLGGLDIFSINLKQGTKVHNLGYPVNTSADDFGLICDSSELHGYFSSNREDQTDRILRYKKRPVVVQLVGVVYAKYREHEPLANQAVRVTNLATNETDTLFSNEFGQFSKPLVLNANYRITTQKDEFVLMQEGAVSTENIRKDSVFYCELPLKPTTIQVHLRVVEAKTGKVIPLAMTSVTDYSINKDTMLLTNEEGMVTLKVDRNKSYWAHAAKKGYIDDDVAFNSANENDKVIDLELRLPPIVKGDKFKLENIFYDLNKSTLRPKSMIALDKLADFIIKNDLRIELSAHTDSRGSDAYNLKLSQARAQSCVDYLISKGVKKSSIRAKGYGETQLINKCKNGVQCPEEMHQENRRTEVKIL